MTPENLKDLLKQYGLKPNKTFGQNFLLDEIVMQDMIDSAGVTGETAVLEVGPGIATLTRHLCQRAKFVLSVEKDKKFVPILRNLQKEFPNFDYAVSDILSFDFGTALKKEKSFRVVANIPYYITGKIVQLFLRAKRRPKSITLLVQKEVGENITAQPGQLNLLGISVQLFGNASIVAKVPARSFFPIPKVDSVVVHIEIPEKSKFKIADEKKLFRILRACFSGKRKQLHNTLTNNLHLDKSYVEQVLHKLDIAETARPQQLSVEQWLKLCDEINL